MIIEEPNREFAQKKKRIAKNTVVVYINLLLRMVLGLYTSRLALEALGVSDFGLYNVVGGVVALFTFISSSLAGTTVRFINVEKGKKDGDLHRVFNVCHVLHIGMAVFLFILLEVVGLYYIDHYLNVAPEKKFDAIFVFQISTATCCLGVINVPFASLFNASEKFLFTSIVTISVKVVQLAILFWLITYDGNRLRIFALMVTLTTLVSFVVYHYYCYRNWSKIVKWKFLWDGKLYKEVLSFSFYNLISTIARMSRSQGAALIINYFFGTMVNGAFAVAKSVERNVFPFANNFFGAAVPQITQNYSSGNMERVFYLVSRIGKYCMLMMTLAFFPLWSELDFILHLWLVEVPDGALTFCQIILLMLYIAVTDGGISNFVNATGKVARLKTTYSILTLACIPLGIAILSIGYPAYMLLIIFLIADIIWRIIQLWMVKEILQFPVKRYCRDAYYPVFKCIVVIVLAMFALSFITYNTITLHIVHLILVFILTCISIYLVGLKSSERNKIRSIIINHLTPYIHK